MKGNGRNKDTSIFTFGDSFSQEIVPGKVAIAEVKLHLVSKIRVKNDIRV